jgi:hypothetical protein
VAGWLIREVNGISSSSSYLTKEKKKKRKRKEEEEGKEKKLRDCVSEVGNARELCNNS